MGWERRERKGEREEGGGCEGGREGRVLLPR